MATVDELLMANLLLDWGYDFCTSFVKKGLCNWHIIKCRFSLLMVVGYPWIEFTVMGGLRYDLIASPIYYDDDLVAISPLNDTIASGGLTWLQLKQILAGTWSKGGIGNCQSSRSVVPGRDHCDTRQVCCWPGIRAVLTLISSVGWAVWRMCDPNRLSCPTWLDDQFIVGKVCGIVLVWGCPLVKESSKRWRKTTLVGVLVSGCCSVWASVLVQETAGWLQRGCLLIIMNLALQIHPPLRWWRLRSWWLYARVQHVSKFLIPEN